MTAIDTAEAQTLENYLAGDYHQDMEDIRELEAMLVSVQNLFVQSSDDGRWPYERRAGAVAPKNVAVSHGTQAMIASALGKMTGQCVLTSGDLARLKLPDRDLAKAQAESVDRLVESLASGKLVSGTFGLNDPVTLSHITELARGLAVGEGKANAGKLREKTLEARKLLKTVVAENPAVSTELLPNLPNFGSTVVGDGDEKLQRRDRKPDYVTNAFVPLRIVRSVDHLASSPADTVGDGTEPLALSSAEFAAYRKYFESSLYDQLSFSAIPDSRFDAAELIFCLEGLLLSGRQAVDDRVFEHVLAVLREKQEVSAQWRPNRPIFATSQGMTMLPVSVESAVSLVRSIELMDRQQSYYRFSTMGIALARRFWHWLRAHKVEFEAPSRSTGETVKLTGWHSEHVDDPKLIHLWATSQVVEFLLAFREMLQRHVAGRTLLLSRLKLDRGPTGLPEKWEEKWTKTAATFEPRPDTKNQVYVQRLTEDFVLPWGRRKPTNFSMLLYGPPGTGKSTLAEKLAEALGMRMVTVTVSDFLGRGGENVEARAKAIFQTLEAQLDTVILFDEIDSFLLDRDTERYGNQDSMFQFLTPGMLTKINDLRKRERSIFIIATNYANRIDPAIKRRGRIDQSYLLSLPSKEKRLEVIKQLRGGEAVGTAVRDEVAAGTLFFGFPDLNGLVKEAGRKGGGDENLVELIRGGTYRPATSIDTYLKRFSEENFPFGEIDDLRNLKRETDENFDLDDLVTKRGEKFLRLFKEWHDDNA